MGHRGSQPPKSRRGRLRLDDPLVWNAKFLEEHPGWSPQQLADADPELIETMALVREKFPKQR